MVRLGRFGVWVLALGLVVVASLTLATAELHDARGFGEGIGISPAVASNDPVSVVMGLIDRQFGAYGLSSDKLQLESLTVDQTPSVDVWEIDWNTTTRRPILRGSSAIALVVALRSYLEETLNVQLSWTGDQATLLSAALSLNDTLPQPQPQRNQRPYQYFYYENVCTVSYSMAFWNWTRWEREIDWMALNGINLPLAFTGQEYIWLRVYQYFGLTKETILNFFGGPAFFSWQRMGNIQGSWPTPIPENFINAQFELQIQILQRMQEYGMKPVLPGFAGHVPAAFHLLYPDSQVVLSNKWSGFDTPDHCCVTLLQPTDPMFQAVGSVFIKEQMSLYQSYGINVSHIYSVDTYNEELPASNNSDYLYAAGKVVIETLRAGDPDAIWLMQGWLFYSAPFWTPTVVESYLSGIPNDSMIILDLYAEYAPVWNYTKGFYGKMWIWCMLHNFGGQLAVYGMMPAVATGPIIARESAIAGSNMVGMGLTMEGINQNYVMYDLALKMGWWTASPDLDQFVANYTLRRYGKLDSKALEAWKILQYSAYNSTEGSGRTKSEIFLRPGFELFGYSTVPTWYEPATLAVAWNRLLNVSDPEILATTTYQYDLVDVGHQVLSNLYIPFLQVFNSSYNCSLDSLTDSASRMLEIIEDLDVLMSSNGQTLLGSWIESARWWAQDNETVADYYEYQARNQITLWGPDGQISDYAAKMWGGLIKDYYLSRWQIFFSEAIGSFGSAFNTTQFNEDVLAFEQLWNNSTDPYPTTPTGDPVEISHQLYDKYIPIICSTYASNATTILHGLC